jgi:hypothetical protein
MHSLLVLLLVLPMTAMAAAKGSSSTTSSEKYYQTEAGKSDITFNIGYSRGNAKISGVTIHTKDLNLGAEYEQGANETFAWGVGVGYETLKTEPSGLASTTQKGLNNIDAFMKSHTEAGPGQIRFKLTLSVSPDDHEIDTNGDENNFTGGHSLNPELAYEIYSGDNIFGAALSTEVGVGKRTVNDKSGAGKHKEGGDESTDLTLYMEHSLANHQMIGGEFTYETVSDTTYDDGTPDHDEASPVFALAAYGRLPMGSGDFLPFLGYVFTNDDSVGGQHLSYLNGWILQAKYRIAF